MADTFVKTQTRLGINDPDQQTISVAVTELPHPIGQATLVFQQVIGIFAQNLGMDFLT
jgi:hypothetical protein